MRGSGEDFTRGTRDTAGREVDARQALVLQTADDLPLRVEQPAHFSGRVQVDSPLSGCEEWREGPDDPQQCRGEDFRLVPENSSRGAHHLRGGAGGRWRPPNPPTLMARAPGAEPALRRRWLYFPVIRNRVVPQDEHLPLMAWRPFLKVTSFGESISLFFFSLTQ